MVEFRVPEMGSFPWQLQVLDKDLSTPPGSPSEGDRYIVGPTATGDWATHENDIAWFDGAAWRFDTPLAGFRTWIIDEGKFYDFLGAEWEIDPQADDLDELPDGTTYGRVKNTELIEGEVERLLVVFPIISVSIGADEFVVDGDQTDKISNGNTIEVHDSTGNNGIWTVSTITYSSATKQTTIAVVEDVTDATADGRIKNNTAPGRVTGAEARDAFDRRGVFNPNLKAIIFNLDNVT